MLARRCEAEDMPLTREVGSVCLDAATRLVVPLPAPEVSPGPKADRQRNPAPTTKAREVVVQRVMVAGEQCFRANLTMVVIASAHAGQWC